MPSDSCSPNRITLYPNPVRRYVSRAAGQVFKFTLNHKFLQNTLNGDLGMILGVIRRFRRTLRTMVSSGFNSVLPSEIKAGI